MFMRNRELEADASGRGAPSFVRTKLALQIDSDDPSMLRRALTTASAALNDCRRLGVEGEVEIVAHGDGVAQFLAGCGAAAEEIARVRGGHGALRISVCGGWLDLLERRSGKRPAPLPGVGEVRSGAVRLIELQMAGWKRINLV